MEVARPVVYQIDARVWLGEESRRERRPVMLDSIPPGRLDSISGLGLSWVSLSGIWEAAPRSAEHLLRSAPFLEDFQEALLDLSPRDIDGPPFQVKRHRVRADFGGDEALEGLRDELARRGLQLMLDFVPGQVTVDHPWVEEHPEFFVQGSADDLLREPRQYFRGQGGPVLARGLAPGPVPWPWTLQLNYGHSGLRREMTAELLSIAGRADGVRVLSADAALPDVQRELWGGRSSPADGSSHIERSFWLDAVPRARSLHPHLILLAEADSRRERLLRNQGFDYVSSALLREALLEEDAIAALGVLHGAAREPRAARSLEAPGTARAAAAFRPELHPAAAIIHYLAPGMALFQDGQLEGRRIRQNPCLSRRREEPTDRELAAFYQRLLEILQHPALASGTWEPLAAREAWPGNSTWRQFVIFLMRGGAGETLLATVNYGPLRGQCYVDLTSLEARGRQWMFQDLFSVAVYERTGDELEERGLFIDLEPWDYNVFEIAKKRIHAKQP